MAASRVAGGWATLTHVSVRWLRARTGSLSSLPRTLAIFEKKSKWALLVGSIDSWDGER